MAISAELGDVLEQAVNDLVATGRYNSKSEVLREGVRLVQEREARFKELQALIQEGEDDIAAGRVYSAEEVFTDLMSAIDQIAQKAS
tara:strand:- start:2226 stop:2486 length:261 start_codon:yes stop_codon:yes gene_type:complete